MLDNNVDYSPINDINRALLLENVLSDSDVSGTTSTTLQDQLIFENIANSVCQVEYTIKCIYVVIILYIAILFCKKLLNAFFNGI